MIVKLPDDIINIVCGGDIHGAFNLLISKIKWHDIKDTALFLCGDVGLGFEKLSHYKNNIIPKLHKICKKQNVIIIMIAGNHDDPAYYDGNIINTKWVKAVPNYCVVEVGNKRVLCISGAISIDRSYRKNLNNTKLNNYIYYHKCNMETALQQCPLYYWENEAVKYQPKLTERVDIICSHSAPSFCYPTDKGSIVMEYAQYDETLLEDIQKERETLDLIYNDYKDEITHWYYGHFHQSMFQEINNIKFRLLDIGELIQHVDDNYIW